MNQPARPEPDEATRAEIAQLNDEQRATLERVMEAHPTLTHKEALDHCKASGL